MHKALEQSIIAQSTPSGNGALALVRISGEDSFSLTNKISEFPRKKDLTKEKSHTIHYGWVLNEHGERIDQVLFLLMKAPHTFTGENVIEITCHNNSFIIQSIIQQAIKNGAREAQPGEFTRRAFENQKLDLLQAEAINELICAQTESALKKSLAQLDGSLSSWIQNIEKKLITMLAWSEASFEFLDDEGDFGTQLKKQNLALLSTITTAKKTFAVQQQIREGVRIALIGSVNAGKSSLFNRLLNQERSIVTDIAGTTRDSVEAGLYRNGNHWTLIDTAGLRQTKDIVEKKGIQRSFDEAQKADIILLVIDGSRTITKAEEAIYEELLQNYPHKIINVITKKDLPPAELPEKINQTIKISSTTGVACNTLENLIEKKIASLLAQSDAPFLINKRHYNALLNLENKLTTLQTMLDQEIQYELISYHIRETLEQLSQLTGKSINESGMDAVFREFCVGK